MPFALLISTIRRRKILQSVTATDPNMRRDGEKILNDAKKQLAEKLAREAAEDG